MQWRVDLAASTARNDAGQLVRFRKARGRTLFGPDCCYDPDGVAWQGVADKQSFGSISDEMTRLRVLIAAVDAYRAAQRNAIDPFPPD